MNRFLTSLVSFAALLTFALASTSAFAADVADNAYILQLSPNGDQVATTIPFTSNSVNQEIIVTATGALGINAVVRGNLNSAVIASGSAVSLTTATPKTITSVSLTAGTWQVYAYIDYVTSSATTTLFQQGWATTTNSFTNSLQSQDTFTADWNPMTTTSVTLNKPSPIFQFSLTSTTTVYLVGQATFSAGTVTAYGTLFYKQIK